ncbi:hypothetical protein Pelo_15666 [Pelomyxa schiedti]|nr:hypothetical protein Pelo_15666 [Pelomyxa schiedti]
MDDRPAQPELLRSKDDESTDSACSIRDNHHWWPLFRHFIMWEQPYHTGTAFIAVNAFFFLLMAKDIPVVTLICGALLCIFASFAVYHYGTKLAVNYLGCSESLEEQSRVFQVGSVEVQIVLKTLEDLVQNALRILSFWNPMVSSVACSVLAVLAFLGVFIPGTVLLWLVFVMTMVIPAFYHKNKQRVDDVMSLTKGIVLRHLRAMLSPLTKLRGKRKKLE